MRSRRGAPLATAGRVVAAGAILFLLGGCGILGSYGPPQDRSRFQSAALMADRTVLFSYQHLVYRPAIGLAAFPDGGIPRYLKDENILAAYHIPTGKLRILRRERNRRWTHGQGTWSIQRVHGSVALVTQGGQLRRDLATLAYEDWLLDVASGSFRSLDWRAALAERGLTMKELHLLDDRGTLLFVTQPAASAAPRDARSDVWLWVRTPGGAYVPVARTSYHHGLEGDELVYWIPETRRYRAFNVVTQTTRDLPGYRLSPLESPVDGVSIGSRGQELLLGRKGADGWVSEPLPLEPSDLQ